MSRARARALSYDSLVLALLASVAAAFALVPQQHAAGTGVQRAAAEPSRPNVVVIMTDDQRLDEMVHLPKTRRLLGEQGLTFANAISPNSLCCPARAELLTAQYSHNNGVFSNIGTYGGFQALRDKDNTLPVWLQAEGYRTAFVGKYLNGWSPKEGAPRGWDRWDALTDGVYAYTDFTFANNGRPETYRDDYVTTRTTERVTDYIRDFSAEDRPFFVLDALSAPHLAWRRGEKRLLPIPEPKYAHSVPRLANPAAAKPSFNEADMSDKPAFMRRWVPADTVRTTAWARQRARTLASVDDHVAAVVEELARTGELDETVIVFTSDNGFMLGEHRATVKKWHYEESLRVPLLVRGPGFEPGATTRSWVTTVDIGQTILDLTGAQPGRRTDGVSFADLAPDAPPRPVLLESGTKTTRPDGPPWSYHGVRFGRYTYVRHAGGAEELYDSVVDPYQLTSLHGASRYRAVLAQLRVLTEELADCRGPEECSLPPGQPPVPAPVRP